MGFVIEAKHTFFLMGASCMCLLCIVSACHHKAHFSCKSKIEINLEKKQDLEIHHHLVCYLMHLISFISLFTYKNTSCRVPFQLGGSHPLRRRTLRWLSLVHAQVKVTLVVQEKRGGIVTQGVYLEGIGDFGQFGGSDCEFRR